MGKKYELMDIAKVSDLSANFQYPEIYRDLADFTRGSTMEILHEDGLYRHLRFTNEYDNEYIPLTSFDVITWPHHITLECPMVGAITFSRLADMVEFFTGYGLRRGKFGGVDLLANFQYPDYLLQKAVPVIPGTADRSTFSFDKVRRSVDGAVASWLSANPEVDGDAVRKRVEGAFRGSVEHDEPGFREEILHIRRSNEDRLRFADGFTSQLLHEIESEFDPDPYSDTYRPEAEMSRPKISDFTEEHSYENLLACYILSWACDSYMSVCIASSPTGEWEGTGFFNWLKERAKKSDDTAWAISEYLRGLDRTHETVIHSSEGYSMWAEGALRCERFDELQRGRISRSSGQVHLEWARHKSQSTS